jgi:hypothetical protein
MKRRRRQGKGNTNQYVIRSLDNLARQIKSFKKQFKCINRRIGCINAHLDNQMRDQVTYDEQECDDLEQYSYYYLEFVMLKDFDERLVKDFIFLLREVNLDLDFVLDLANQYDKKGVKILRDALYDKCGDYTTDINMYINQME